MAPTSIPASSSRQSCERIDLNSADGRQRLDALRAKLASQGELVSPAGRQRTIDVFGEPLTPRQVVERICGDVKAKGLAALLDYTRRIDGVTVSRESLFVDAAALAAATMFPRVLGAASVPVQKPNSVINGVRVGAISYSYRSALTSAEELLQALITDGLSEVELMGAPIQAFAGFAVAPGRRRSTQSSDAD